MGVLLLLNNIPTLVEPDGGIVVGGDALSIQFTYVTESLASGALEVGGDAVSVDVGTEQDGALEVGGDRLPVQIVLGPGGTIQASSPSSGTNDASVGDVAWTSPGNVLASDDSRATAALSSLNPQSQYLVAKDFQALSVPSGVVIEDIEVTVEWRETSGNGATALEARLVVGGSIGGNDLSASEVVPDATDGTTVYSGSPTAWGFPSLTGAQVNAADFGFALRALGASPNADVEVDHVSIQVTFAIAAVATGPFDGGVTVGGGAVAHQLTFAGVASGALEVGGDGLSQQGTVEADGALEVGGDANLITAVVRGADGAVVLGGDALPLDRSILIDGAVEVGGDGLLALQWLVSGEAVASGAVELGGDAVATPRVGRVHIVDGAVEVGGDANAFTFALTHTADGGIKVGGFGPNFGVARGDGAIKVGGDAVTLTRNRFFEPDGAVTLAGTAHPVQFNEAGSTTTVGTGRHRGPTTQAAILRAIRDRLVAEGIYREEQVYVALDPFDGDTAPVADTIAVILPGSKLTQQDFAAGGGRWIDALTETVEIRVYSRTRLDYLDRGTQWTTHRNFGGYGKVRTMANALHLCDLRDSSGTVLVIEPMRHSQIGGARSSLKHKDAGWGHVPVTFEVSYRTDYDLPATAFSPSDLSGLQLWYDAAEDVFTDTSGTVPANNLDDLVAYWGSQGPSVPLIQSSSQNRPLYKPGGAGINARDAIRFVIGGGMPTTSDVLFLQALPFSSISSATVFAVFVPFSTSTDATVLSLHTGSLTTINAFGLSGPPAKLQFTQDANKMAGVSSVSAGVPILATYRWSGTTVAFWINGVVDGSASAAIGTRSPNLGSVGGIGTSFRFFNERIGEVLLYNYALSDASREAVEAYLMAKWGLP